MLGEGLRAKPLSLRCFELSAPWVVGRRRCVEHSAQKGVLSQQWGAEFRYLLGRVILSSGRAASMQF